MGGVRATIDPLIMTAARAIGATLVDLLTSPADLGQAQAEFHERTDGGIGGRSWVPPLLPRDFRAPIDYRWPEYVTIECGTDWWIPQSAEEA